MMIAGEINPPSKMTTVKRLKHGNERWSLAAIAPCQDPLTFESERQVRIGYGALNKVRNGHSGNRGQYH